jgi:hypothetical protein
VNIVVAAVVRWEFLVETCVEELGVRFVSIQVDFLFMQVWSDHNTTALLFLLVSNRITHPVKALAVIWTSDVHSLAVLKGNDVFVEIENVVLAEVNDAWVVEQVVTNFDDGVVVVDVAINKLEQP